MAADPVLARRVLLVGACMLGAADPRRRARRSDRAPARDRRDVRGEPSQLLRPVRDAARLLHGPGRVGEAALLSRSARTSSTTSRWASSSTRRSPPVRCTRRSTGRPSGARSTTTALEKMVEIVKQPGNVLGMHPEGTRGKGDDPYTFLPAQPGVGKLALVAQAGRHPRVHPRSRQQHRRGHPLELRQGGAAVARGARGVRQADRLRRPDGREAAPDLYKKAADRFMMEIGKLSRARARDPRRHRRGPDRRRRSALAQ